MEKNMDIELIPLKETTDLPDSPCPTCKRILNRASAEKMAIPEPGDVTLCFRCGEILIFADNMHLRLPTQVELWGLEAQPETWEYLKMMQAKFRNAVDAFTIDRRKKTKPQ